MLFIRSTSKIKVHKRAENTEMERQGKTKEAGLAKALMGLKIDILIKYLLRRYNYNDSLWTEQHSFKIIKQKLLEILKFDKAMTSRDIKYLKKKDQVNKEKKSIATLYQ